MGRRGPLPQSREARLLAGNPGKRPLPAPGGGIAHLLSGYVPPAEVDLGPVPEPPKPLTGEARAEWDRVAPELHRRGWLRPVETTALYVYCRSWEEWRRAEEGLRRALADPKAKASDVRVWQSIVRSAERFTLRMGREFGMTPASRARLPEALPEPGPAHPASEFFE